MVLFMYFAVFGDRIRGGGGDTQQNLSTEPPGPALLACLGCPATLHAADSSLMLMLDPDLPRLTFTSVTVKNGVEHHIVTTRTPVHAWAQHFDMGTLVLVVRLSLKNCSPLALYGITTMSDLHIHPHSCA